MAKKSSGGIAELIARMKADRSNLVADGTPPEAIEELESELGTRLPASYVEFLRAFDGGEFGFARVHCITENGAGFFDFRQQLREFFENNPWMGTRHLVPFACSYGGDMYCFDLTDITDDEPAVVMFDHEGDDMQELKLEAPTFAHWVAAHYEMSEKEPHRVTVYVSCADDLEPFAGDDVALDADAGNDSLAKRCHLDSTENTAWAVNHDQPDQIAKFIERAVKQVDSPIDLFIYDDMEMNSAAPWKSPFAKLTMLGKTHELYAGDYLRFHPDGKVEQIPAKRYGNQVPKSAASGTLTCSFCGAAQEDVKKLIAGPGVYICDSCTELCWDIVNEENAIEEPV